MKTGTTWDDYYRYDNEGNGAGSVPSVSKLLFRESGSNDPLNAGGGFLVDNVSLASSACRTTGLVRDGINLTAAEMNPTGTVSGTVDASLATSASTTAPALPGL